MQGGGGATDNLFLALHPSPLLRWMEFIREKKRWQETVVCELLVFCFEPFWSKQRDECLRDEHIKERSVCGWVRLFAWVSACVSVPLCLLSLSCSLLGTLFMSGFVHRSNSEPEWLSCLEGTWGRKAAHKKRDWSLLLELLCFNVSVFGVFFAPGAYPKHT